MWVIYWVIEGQAPFPITPGPYLSLTSTDAASSSALAQSCLAP